MTDPIIMVVEDDPVWRTELAIMYSRILRGQSSHKHPDDSFHPSVHTFATAREAIEFVKKKPGDRSNAKPKVDILSLDLNLGRNGGGTGFDVLNAAVRNGQRFATIAVSGYAYDDDLRDQLSDKTYQELQSLRTKVETTTSCECLVLQKHLQERFGDAATQVKRLEQDLVSQSSGNVLRQIHAKLRETVADLNGKCLCLHFKLPSTLYRPCPGDWIATTVRKNGSRLNQLGIWKDVFFPLDENAIQTDILARLLFLIKPKTYLAGVSLQGDIAEPFPEEEWLSPRPLKPGLTAGEAFLLLQLIAQRWEAQSSGPREVLGYSPEAVVAREEFTQSELQIVGLARPTTLGWQEKDSIHQNGESLSVMRKTDGYDNKALKTNTSRLHTKLKKMLGDVNYSVIVADEVTYQLACLGTVFVHRVKD